MAPCHFRLLYREFLFRIIDLELLAPQGNTLQLLGQFAALLIVISFWVLFFPTLMLADLRPSELTLVLTWVVQHFLISTTMLVVGLFAVLCWNSLFPDWRDIMVLKPLPVHARTLFSAKAAAVATGLLLAIVSLNIFPGLAAPFAFRSAVTVPPPTYDTPLPPVPLNDLRPVLDRDMLAARDPVTHALVLGPNASIAIGVIQHGQRRIFVYGSAQPDSLFPIGSITKTFTALLLAQMAAQGKVRLDEPVRELLPPGTALKPAGNEITLLDLATQHSGLPAMPSNFMPADLEDPYADYHVPNLYAYVAQRGLARPPNPPFVYSNLGMGLLGQALANREGSSYGESLQREILGPLRLSDTSVSLSPTQRSRLLQGYSGSDPHEPVRVWNLDALAGAGAIFSTAGDMLTYLEAQLHPENFPSLSAALTASHTLRATAAPSDPAQRIALAWFHEQHAAIYQHNGATAGYTSYAFFSPEQDLAAVVLTNTGPDIRWSPIQLGDHLRQRLLGQPAVSLAPVLVQGNGGFLGLLRSFAAYSLTLLAAGTFVLCALLTLQGLVQLLPRQLSLRLSSLLQLASFCLFVVAYLWQPVFTGPEIFVAAQGSLPWIPSYWFFALFQALNGPLPTVLIPLFRCALIALALSLLGAFLSYFICYFRTLPLIAEQPNIAPAPRHLRWLPRFGNSFHTAIGQFTTLSLLRSREHRLILSFFLGVALGLALFISKLSLLPQLGSSNDGLRHVSAPLLTASILLTCAAVFGVRILFTLPLDLRANWLFQVAAPLPVPACLSSARRVLYTLSLLPVGLLFALVFFALWPAPLAAKHLVILLLLGTLVGELSLFRFRKIPFTCSWLPGKSRIHLATPAIFVLVLLTSSFTAFELAALTNDSRYVLFLSVLLVAVGIAHWLARSAAHSPQALIRFDEEPPPAVLELNLRERGVLSAAFPARK